MIYTLPEHVRKITRALYSKRHSN